MTDPTRAQPEPAGLSVESGMIPMEYADVDSGARIVCEPSEDRPSTGCWVVCNSRHISPLKEFPTAEAAYHALRAAIAADRAQPEPAGLSDEDLWEMYQGQGTGSFSPIEFARAVEAATLARAQRQPVPPEPGDVQELVSSLRSQRANYLEKLQRLERYDQAMSAVMPSDFKDWWENSKDEWPDVAAGVIENLRKREKLAWEQVERLSRPHPVLVSERLPGVGDCDEEGRCWWWDRYEGCWWYLKPISSEQALQSWSWTHWLPAHALPLPGEVSK